MDNFVTTENAVRCLLDACKEMEQIDRVRAAALFRAAADALDRQNKVGPRCPECGVEVPEWAAECHRCGAVWA